MEQLGQGGRERERERERIRVLKNSYRTKGSYFVRPDADPFSVVRVADARRTLGAEGESVDLRAEVEHIFDARLHHNGGKKIFFFVKNEGEKMLASLKLFWHKVKLTCCFVFIACLTA